MAGIVYGKIHVSVKNKWHHQLISHKQIASAALASLMANCRSWRLLFMAELLLPVGDAKCSTH